LYFCPIAVDCHNGIFWGADKVTAGVIGVPLMTVQGFVWLHRADFDSPDVAA
jgi:hypothetical protein